MVFSGWWAVLGFYPTKVKNVNVGLYKTEEPFWSCFGVSNMHFGSLTCCYFFLLFWPLFHKAQLRGVSRLFCDELHQSDLHLVSWLHHWIIPSLPGYWLFGGWSWFCYISFPNIFFNNQMLDWCFVQELWQTILILPKRYYYYYYYYGDILCIYMTFNPNQILPSFLSSPFFSENQFLPFHPMFHHTIFVLRLWPDYTTPLPFLLKS